ncbi:YesL family protein [Lactococcus piscium]|uniref:YesL family protein n=1 Tax=Pseudolactococcus carnosus TaxID=2749961 RepID=UPI001FB90157|nr:YesL family protein [Lactococcus carnosus]MCJ1996854.1 YesL family protein [Lactococcus carnosus]
MRGLFAIDGNIYKYMLKLYEMMVLNLLFIIASLPIVTIGAALTALYDVTLRMQVGTEKEMTWSFVKSFRKNGMQATKIWLAFLGLIAISFVVISLVNGHPVVLFPLLCLSVLVVGTLPYTFSLVATFENKTGIMMRNGLMLAIQHVPHMLLMLSVAGLLCLYLPIYQRWTLLPVLTLSFSLTAMVQSHFISGILVKLVGEEEVTDR